MGLLSEQALKTLTTPRKKGDKNQQAYIEKQWLELVKKDVSAAAYTMHREYLQQHFNRIDKKLEKYAQENRLAIQLLENQIKKKPLNKLQKWIKGLKN